MQSLRVHSLSETRPSWEPRELAPNKPPLQAKRRALMFHMDGTLTGVERSLILEKQSLKAKNEFEQVCMHQDQPVSTLSEVTFVLLANARRYSLAYQPLIKTRLNLLISLGFFLIPHLRKKPNALKTLVITFLSPHQQGKLQWSSFLKLSYFVHHINFFWTSVKDNSYLGYIFISIVHKTHFKEHSTAIKQP